MKSLYMWINLLTISIPFLFSFHPRILFYKKWPSFFSAAILVAIVFVIWDGIFTKQGVWGFNDRYVLGIYIFKMPIEEILFFICIPFSCVFTFFCLDKFYNLQWNAQLERYFCLLFVVGLFIIGTIYIDKIYTVTTMYSTAIVCLYLKFVEKVDWFGKVTTVYAILLVPFFMVNGVLTGTGIDEPIVWYNPAGFMGIRMGTIPIEDAFYGYELILLNILMFKRFQILFKQQ